MKKLVLATMLTVTGLGVFAQGKVTFNNIGSTYAANGFPQDRLVRFGSGWLPTENPYGTNFAPLVNFGSTSYRAQLYYGAASAPEGSLIPVASAPAVFRSSTTSIPGTWSPGDRTLVGFDTGATVNLEVKIWDFSLASSYEAAVALGGAYTSLLGHSLMFQYTIPTDPLASPGAFLTPNLAGFVIDRIAPEPTTFSLLSVGAVGVLLFRRKK